jgi:hypothetical protein
MVPLVLWHSRNVLEVQTDELQKLSSFVMGEISLLCFEGFQQHNYDISQRIGRSMIRDKGMDNCLLLRSRPMLEPRSRKYLYIMGKKGVI